MADEILLTVEETPVTLELEVAEVIQIEIGIPGPPGAAGSENPYLIEAFENLAAGQPVFVRTGDGRVELADASAFGTAQVFGIVEAAVLAGFTANVRAIGRLTLADWTLATGSTTLSRGNDYFLDTTSGMLTTTPTQVAGEFVVRVGRAATTDTLEIHVHRSIRKA